MPTYGYECLSCDNQFEIFQSIKDNALTTCDSCGGTLRKRIYPVGIAFKGSGFYVNDYAPKSSQSTGPTTPDAAKTEPVKTEGNAETKAESKPDVKVEAKSETKSETKAESKTPAAASA